MKKRLLSMLMAVLMIVSLVLQLLWLIPTPATTRTYLR